MLLQPRRNSSKLVKTAIVLLSGISLNAFCKEVDISGTLNTTGYVYESSVGSDDLPNTEALTIKPSILGSYSSKRILASLTANHTKINHNSDNDSTSQNYTDLSYTSALTLIENALFITLSGSQNYNAVNQTDFTDEILDSDDLTKSRNNSAQLNFSSPNPIYLGFSLVSSYSKTKTEQSQESLTGIDSESLGVSAQFYQGNNVKALSFNISTQYNDTSRATLQNFESTIIDANLGFPFMREVEFIMTGSLEEYDTGQATSNIDTSGYGAGLMWTPSDEQNISLTYNQLEEGESHTEYVGLTMDWAFSSRTSLAFDYSKRFYGDAYDFDFTHSMKSFRTSVSYSEDITTYSLLNSTSANTSGIFVCEFGSTALSDCYQPDSLDYQLDAGEEFRAYTEIDTDISEEVLFRKSGTASIGYDKRKVKISVDATYLRTEYLESDRLNITRGLSFNLNYALSRKTDISFVSKVAKNQYSNLEYPETTVTTSLDMTRDLGRNLTMSVAAKFVDRKSDSLERDASNKRLTVGLTYSF